MPVEGLSKKRVHKLGVDFSRHNLLFGRGMVSDDTEHTCMCAQAMAASGLDEEIYVKEFARMLRLWLLWIPVGIGLSTLKACIKLWLGRPPETSGVFSAGDGPAMRSAIIGVACGDDTDKMTEMVRLSTRVTHTDPRAEWGARTIALAARMSARAGEKGASSGEFFQEVSRLLGNEAHDFLELIRDAIGSAIGKETTESYAEFIGQKDGVGGYIYNAVPVAIHAWLRYPNDFEQAVLEVVKCGGDTDSTAAMVGGIVGANVGVDGIPKKWRDGLFEWTHGLDYMQKIPENLHNALLTKERQPIVKAPVIPTALRNTVFLGAILAHGFRRMLPPY